MSAALQPEPLETQEAFASTLAFEREPSFVARLGAELFGTFLLVFVGIGLAVYATELDVGAMGITLGIGLALMAGLATVGHISGHFNPAVTLGSAVAGRTPWVDVLPLWLGQLVGGAVAATALFLTIPTSLFGSDKATETARDLMNRGANGFDTHAPLYTTPKNELFEMFTAQGISRAEIDAALASGELPASFPTVPLVSALFIEIIATALFVGIFLAVTGKIVRSVSAPLVIGLTFTVLLLIATPFTNGGLNPARSFASALFAEPWALGQLWLFFAAPLLGAAIAGLVYRLAVVPAAPIAGSETHDDGIFEVDEADVAIVDKTDADEVAGETVYARSADAAVEADAVDEVEESDESDEERPAL